MAFRRTLVQHRGAGRGLGDSPCRSCGTLARGLPPSRRRRWRGRRGDHRRARRPRRRCRDRVERRLRTRLLCAALQLLRAAARLLHAPAACRLLRLLIDDLSQQEHADENESCPAVLPRSRLLLCCRCPRPPGRNPRNLPRRKPLRRLRPRHPRWPTTRYPARMRRNGWNTGSRSCMHSCASPRPRNRNGTNSPRSCVITRARWIRLLGSALRASSR